MNNLLKIIVSCVCILLLTSCVVHDSRHKQVKYRKYNNTKLPPGQAKKVYGGSATDYAPGQQKKHYKKNKDYNRKKRMK